MSAIHRVSIAYQDSLLASAFAARWRLRPGAGLEDESFDERTAENYRNFFGTHYPEIPGEAVSAFVDAVIDCSKIRT